MSDFYITVPSNSSLQEFPNNKNNSFKIRLPKTVRLEGDWRVALASISMPDPKNEFPSWMKENLPLIYNCWYHSKKANMSNRKKLAASFTIADIKDHVDLSRMSGTEFMRSVVYWFRKKYIEKDLDDDKTTGYTTGSGVNRHFYPIFQFEGDDLVIDSSNVELHDFGWSDYFYSSYKSPSIFIHKQLGLDMGWFEEVSNSNAQFRVKPGPNLIMELRGNGIPSPDDMRISYGPNARNNVYDRYMFEPRIQGSNELSNYVRLSLSVNWRFINLNNAFKSVFGKTARSVYVYSDIGGSSIVGDQITDFIREVEYKKEGKGTHYFEPAHLQYIPLRKDLLDIIEIQLAESSGGLANFGAGVSTVAFHLKRV